MPFEDGLGAVGEAHREGWVDDRAWSRGACAVGILAITGLRRAGAWHKNAGETVTAALANGAVSNDVVEVGSCGRR